MALLAAFNAYGYDFENGNVYYDILSVEDHTCEVVSFGLEYANSYSGEVVIPATVFITIEQPKLIRNIRV